MDEPVAVETKATASTGTSGSRKRRLYLTRHRCTTKEEEEVAAKEETAAAKKEAAAAEKEVAACSEEGGSSGMERSNGEKSTGS